LDEQTVSSRDREVFVEVKELWKIFGPGAENLLDSEVRFASKEEIQEESGCVLGLRDISLEVYKGEFFIIMGLSGSGKSTLIRCFLRLVEPTTGEILVDGEDVCRYDKSRLMGFRRHKASMVFQHYGLLPHYTVLDNVAYGLKVRGTPGGLLGRISDFVPLPSLGRARPSTSEEAGGVDAGPKLLTKEERYRRAREVIETVGLKGWEDYLPGSLSGGMQQRVGLARALATDPGILLMDEPFSGLDPLIRRQMQDELVELQDRLHKTIIFVTHDLYEALKLGDRIAIMRDGEIIQIGSPEEIITSPADDYVREFVQDASPAKVLTASSIMKQPDVLLYEWEGPKTARQMLRSAEREHAFVVNKNRRLLGLVSRRELSELIERGGKSLREIVHEDLAAGRPDMLVEELFPLATSSPYPVPVLDENGRFLGEVGNRTILDSMIQDKGESEDV